MSYRKARIPIRTKDGIEYRDGYKFDACFSNGEFFEIGVYKVTRNLWIIALTGASRSPSTISIKSNGKCHVTFRL